MTSVSFEVLQRIVGDNPDLSLNGWRYSHFDGADHEHSQAALRSAIDQFDRAVEYLSTVKRRKSPYKGCTSYTWKHRAERFHRDQRPGDPYVANGAFIAAAIHLGFAIEREFNSPNCFINISSGERGLKNPGLASYRPIMPQTLVCHA